MKICMSFSASMIYSFRGELDLGVFDEFHLGVSREHIFRTDGHVPCEALRLNRNRDDVNRPRVHVSNDGVPLESLDQAVRVHWIKYRNLIAGKDREGKVHFGVGRRVGWSAHAKVLVTRGHGVWNEYWTDLNDLKHSTPQLDYGPEEKRCFMCGWELEADDLICPACKHEIWISLGASSFSR